MIFKRILGIAACDPKGVMGRNGKLPWHYPEDLKHFLYTVCASPIIMGYQTFLSLPARYFDQRMGIVFSRREFLPDKNLNLLFVSSLSEFLALEGVFKDLYVIGGSQIYSLFLKENLLTEFILTRFKSYHEGDTFFHLSLLDGWLNFKIQENCDFCIHQYFPPFGGHTCI